MNYTDIIESINNKNFSSIYLLHGEESYFINKISKFLENGVIKSHNQPFDQKVLYGKEINIDDLICDAKSFPMIDDNQLIIVKEAQGLRRIEKLEDYINQHQSQTILVICYNGSKVRKNARWYKALVNNNFIVFESNKLYPNQLPSWLSNYLKSENLVAKPKVIAMILEYLGNDLEKISNEIKKIKSLVKNKEISDLDVEKYIGISRKYNNFELQDRIANKDYKESLQIVSYFSKNSTDNPFILTIGMLYSFFSKLLIYHTLSDKSKGSVSVALKINPFFTQSYHVASINYSFEKCISIIKIIKEMDLKSKGVYSGFSDSSLKEMVFRIIHE